MRDRLSGLFFRLGLLPAKTVAIGAFGMLFLWLVASALAIDMTSGLSSEGDFGTTARIVVAVVVAWSDMIVLAGAVVVLSATFSLDRQIKRKRHSSFLARFRKSKVSREARDLAKDPGTRA